jgi:hypothetical protein
LVQRDDLYISTTNNRLFGTHLHMPGSACGCLWLSRGLLVSEWLAHLHLYRRGAKDAHPERRAAILRRHSMRFTGPRSIIYALTCDCKAIILPCGAAERPSPSQQHIHAAVQHHSPPPSALTVSQRRKGLFYT